uniref:Bromo domain-containing protein n=1 Tax=Steinernema glaseri TaxID=37863 RepID=A0A1I8AU73_9BILA
RVRKKQSKAEETLAPQTSTVASTVSWTTSPTSRGLPTISATESCTESRARSCKSRFLSSSSASETTTRAMCDCGSDVKVSTADTEAQVKAMNVLDLLRPTYCSPIDYDQYRPVPQGLMSLIG